MPIKTIDLRFPRLGYFSLGYQVKAKAKKGGETIRPTVSDTIVVHAASAEILEPFAEEYGGKVAKSLTWTEETERWLVVTERTEIPVVIPSSDPDLVCTQWMEAWASSGLRRRCDGVETVMWRKDPDKTKDEKVGELCDQIVPCICKAQGLEEKEQCKPTVRLNVVPVDIATKIKGIGVFTVRSTGYFTNAELKGDLELLQAMIGKLGASIPLLLSVEQVKSSRGMRPKFRLNLATTPAEAFELAASNRPAFAPPLRVEALPAGEEDPVGRFVDKPSDPPLPGEDGRGGGGSDKPDQAVEPAVVAPAPEAKKSKPPGEVNVLYGIEVRFMGGEAAKTDAERCVNAQWVTVNRIGEKAGLSAEQIHEIFRARHDITGGMAKKETVQEFANWLGVEVKKLVKEDK